MKPYFYKKLPTLGRVFLALIGAQYILIIPQDHPLSQLLQLKGYYVALLASTVIAWLLIWLSHQVHLQLNQRLPWEGRMVRRLLAQVFFGLVLMMGLDLLLVWCYFYLYHQDFLHSRYMRVEAQMVGWMLLCLNITRICYDLIQEKQNQNKLFVDDQEFVHYIQACLGRKRSRIA
ncbi:MAG: hypothetical protein KJ712_07800, partial [Bacteroidetes bacterium]|nr:hypothetical protein [Bacteroidota bacterium]